MKMQPITLLVTAALLGGCASAPAATTPPSTPSAAEAATTSQPPATEPAGEPSERAATALPTASPAPTEQRPAARPTEDPTGAPLAPAAEPPATPQIELPAAAQAAAGLARSDLARRLGLAADTIELLGAQPRRRPAGPSDAPGRADGWVIRLAADGAAYTYQVDAAGRVVAHTP